jgi:hypothetical protein
MYHIVVQHEWRRITFARGISTSIEPSSPHLAAEAKKPGSKGYGNRDDVLLSFVTDLVVGNVSVVHPGGTSSVSHAEREGPWRPPAPEDAAAQRAGLALCAAGL